MNVLEAKNVMGNLAAKAKAIAEDATISNTEKKSALDALDVDMKEASLVIGVELQAKALSDASGSAQNFTSEAKSVNGERMPILSIGQQIIASDEYKSIRSGEKKSFSHGINIKTVNTITEGSAIANGYLNGLAAGAVLPNFLPGVVDIKFPTLSVADLFAQGTTDSPIVSYLQETVIQLNAAGVAEGGAIPQSDDTFARVNAQVGKLAHYLKLTDEMMQDAPALATYLNSRLVLGLQQKEQTELLSGAGVPSISGVLNASGLAPQINADNYLSATTTDVDAIFQMINYIRTNAWLEPNAVLVNPTDWSTIRLRKDSMGQYYAGGPFTGAYGASPYSNVDSIWGVRVVITPAIPVGKILVGCFDTAAQIFRRQGVTVEMTNSNGTDFQNGLITVRAEERLVNAIYRPGAFGIVRLS